MLVRRERPEDTTAIRAVVARAFGAGDSNSTEPVEAGLVDALRSDPTAWLPALSLVAVIDGEVAGHVVCTRAWLEPGHESVLGLGPLAVDPPHQRRGVGAALVHAVLGAADALGEPLVGLLGDPAYYGRFGFVAAGSLGIEAPDPEWGGHFQARTLTAYDPSLVGRFSYASAFTGL